MAGKTVKEMATVQRNWHSIGSKTFRTVVLLSVLISAVAVAFGYYLYYSSIGMSQYRQAWQSAQTVAVASDKASLKKLSETVSFMYERVDGRGIEPYTAGGDINGDYAGYFKKYERLDSFKNEKKVLGSMMDELRTDSLSYVLIDKEKSRMVYLVDSDKSENKQATGYWRNVGKSEMDALTNGTSAGWLDEMIEGSRKETVYKSGAEGKYSSAQKIFESDRYICAAYAVYDTARTNEVGRQFLIQYIILMLFFVLVVSAIAAIRFRKRIAKPISSMTDAAGAYTAASDNIDFFSKLDIRTGDEIESLSLALKEMEQGASEQISEMKQTTAEREWIKSQQQTAESIRSSSLPDLPEVISDIDEADVSAYMKPSKEVGGDFYDCFKLDKRHIGLVIADVDGSGVPAAISSVKYEIMLKIIASKGKNSPAEILEELNWRLASEGGGKITACVWLGILELDTGIMKASNAGHQHPVIRKGEDSWLDCDDEKQGDPLGLDKESSYTEYEIEMEKGDCIFLYSDGVIDAADEEGEKYGAKRLLRALNEDLIVNESLEDEHMSFEIPEADEVAQEEIRGVLEKDDETSRAELGMILERVALSLDDHMDGVVQSDDITMMCLKYFGGTDGSGIEYEPNMFAQISEAETGSRIKVAACKENFRTVFHFIERHLMQTECSFNMQKRILVAAEEIYANITNYAYAPDEGSVDIDIRITDGGSKVKIMFIDSGVAFDPLAKADPAFGEMDGKESMGIFLVKQLMDDVSYMRKDDKNVFTMEKRIDVEGDQLTMDQIL